MDLSSANLKKANLSGARLDNETTFTGAFTDGCTVDRFQLEQLTDYGGLTVANRMTMNIQDSVARLRAAYSGFRQWIHLTALATFVFPYVWFVIVQWPNARFVASDAVDHIPLWKALFRFIYNGGMNWQDGPEFHWSFIAFLFLISYNMLRAVLLWKTKQLEIRQESSGLPAMFSLGESRWGTLLRVATWSFYLYLALTLINTGHFFTMEIPLNHSD